MVLTIKRYLNIWLCLWKLCHVWCSACILWFVCLFEFYFVFRFCSCLKYANYLKCLKILLDANLVKRFQRIINYSDMQQAYNPSSLIHEIKSRKNCSKTLSLYFDSVMILRRNCHSTRKWHGNYLTTICYPHYPLCNKKGWLRPR